MSSSEMALSDCESEDISSKRRKKGVVNDHLYHRNIRKQASFLENHLLTKKESLFQPNQLQLFVDKLNTTIFTYLF